MALKDPKVPIFALISCTQLLGLSFVNFFPTSVHLLDLLHSALTDHGRALVLLRLSDSLRP